MTDEERKSKKAAYDKKRRSTKKQVTMNRWLVIGQGPSKTTVAQPPWTGPSAKRLCRLLDVSMEDFHRRCEVMNVREEYLEKATDAKGDLFKIAFGEAAQRMTVAAATCSHVLICGLQTARACGFRRPDTFQWMPWQDKRLAIIPHPSGINLFWNKIENVKLAERFLRTAWKDGF